MYILRKERPPGTFLCCSLSNILSVNPYIPGILVRLHVPSWPPSLPEITGTPLAPQVFVRSNYCQIGGTAIDTLPGCLDQPSPGKTAMLSLLGKVSCHLRRPANRFLARLKPMKRNVAIMRNEKTVVAVPRAYRSGFNSSILIP